MDLKSYEQHLLKPAETLYSNSLSLSLSQAYDSALQGLRYLVTIPMHDCTEAGKCQAAIGRLESYRSQHPLIPEQQFMEMRGQAEELTGPVPLQLWTSSRKWYQETNQDFHRKMDAALRTRDRLLLDASSSTPSVTPPTSSVTPPSSSHVTLPSSSHVTPPSSSHVTPPSSHVTPLSPSHVTPPSSSHVTPPSSSHVTPPSSPPPSSSHVTPPSSPHVTPTPSHLTPLPSYVTQHSSSLTPPTSSVTRRSSMNPPSYHVPPPSQWRRGSEGWCSPASSILNEIPSKGRGLRKSQSFDYAPAPLCPSPAWPPRRGNTGVHIKGLEVSRSQPRPLPLYLNVLPTPSHLVVFCT